MCSVCHGFGACRELRYDDDDVGVVCKGCYLSNAKCSVRGCNNIHIYKSNLCRHHFLGEPWSEEDCRVLDEQRLVYR